MAMKQSPTLRSRVYNGTSGNLCKEHGIAEFTGDAVDTIVHALEMPVGAKMFGLDVFHENLGSGTGIQVGIHYPNGDDTDDPDFFISGATTSEAVKNWKAAPVSFDKRTVITVTLTGGTGTGKVDLVPEYTNIGIL